MFKQKLLLCLLLSTASFELQSNSRLAEIATLYTAEATTIGTEEAAQSQELSVTQSFAFSFIPDSKWTRGLAAVSFLALTAHTYKNTNNSQQFFLNTAHLLKIGFQGFIPTIAMNSAQVSLQAYMNYQSAQKQINEQILDSQDLKAQNYMLQLKKQYDDSIFSGLSKIGIATTIYFGASFLEGKLTTQNRTAEATKKEINASAKLFIDNNLSTVAQLIIEKSKDKNTSLETDKYLEKMRVQLQKDYSSSIRKLFNRFY